MGQPQGVHFGFSTAIPSSRLGAFDLNPLFSAGPRSIQLGLKLDF